MHSQRKLKPLVYSACPTFLIRLVSVFVWVTLFSGSLAGANTVILHDSFNLMDWLEDVADTIPDGGNLPGGKWISVVQSDWSQPSISGARTSHWAKNAAELEQTRSSIAITLAGHNQGRLRISADIAIDTDEPDGQVALGFLSSVPGTGFRPNSNPVQNFTGLSLSRSGKLSTLVNGVSGDDLTSLPPLTPKKFYPFSYDVDIASGDVSTIKFNGQRVADLDSTAFSKSATSYAAFLTVEGGHGAVDNFTVEAIDGFEKPVMENASWEVSETGGDVVVKGFLAVGNTADLSLFWGPDPVRWAHTNFLGARPDGFSSVTLTNLVPGATYAYRFYATNAMGMAWADSVSNFVAPARQFLWKGTGENRNWNASTNWDAGEFPSLPGERASFVHTDKTPTGIVYLNQPRVQIGFLNLMPADWSGNGFEITTNALGQALEFNAPRGISRITISGNRQANCTLGAPILLKNDVIVSASTTDQMGLVIRNVVVGRHTVQVVKGFVYLDPVQDVVYNTRFVGGKKSGGLAKRGSKTVTLKGDCSLVLAGDWSGGTAVKGGGKLMIDGSVFTNLTRSARGVLFGDSSNTLAIANGGRLINAYSGNNAFFSRDNNVVSVVGSGSQWNLQGDIIVMDANGGCLDILDGGTVEQASGRVGVNTSFNAVSVRGNNSRWNAGGMIGIGHGLHSVSNLLTIADGAVVENTWLWVGGYAPYQDGGGLWNSLVVTNGGKLYTGADDGLGRGSCIGVSGLAGGKVEHNTARISGVGSLWDLQGRDLRIGSVTVGGAFGAFNAVRVEEGGLLTHGKGITIGEALNGGTSVSNDLTVASGGKLDTESLVVGSLSSFDNRLTVQGGTISAGAITVYARNELRVEVGAEVPAPLQISGVAKFEKGSRIKLVATADIKPGLYPLLTAGSIENGGVELDPALASTGDWKLVVEKDGVQISYGIPVASH